MQSCIVVVVNKAVDSDDVTYAAKPRVTLKAVPVGGSAKQIVRKAGDETSLAFSMFDAATSFPATVMGMALFLTITGKDGSVVYRVKGKTSPEMKHTTYFSVADVPIGFYSYDLSVKAGNDYCQQILTGSYVVKN